MSIWSHILDTPDDPAAWTVLADQLQTRGHPRGQLIALQVAGKREEARRWIWDHREILLGPLATMDEAWTIRWRFGFPEQLALVADLWTERTAEVIDVLGADEGLVPLRRLRLCSSVNFTNAVHALSRHDWPMLERLITGPMVVGAGRTDAPVGPFLARAPRLQHLRLELPSTLDDVAHDTLAHLTVHADDSVLAELDPAALPALTSLTLFARTPPDPACLARLRKRRWARLELFEPVAESWFTSKSAGAETLVLHSSVHQEAAQEIADIVRRGSVPTADRDPLLTPASQQEWRRFLRAGRFWQVRRDESTTRLRYGRLGTNGTRKQIEHRGPYSAAKDVRERIVAKRKAGFTETWLEPHERTDSR